MCLPEMMEWSDNDILSQPGVISCDSPNEFLEAWQGQLSMRNTQFACK